MSLHDEVSNLTPFVFDDPESGPGEEFVQRDKVLAILARHPEPAVNICNPCMCTGAMAEGLHVRPQLQVQAPVGEGLENGASGEEREALDDVIQKHWVATPGEFRNALLAWMIAAGYRKPTLPSVDDVALAQKMHTPNNGAHSERGPGDTSWCTCGGNYRDLYEHRAAILLDLLTRGA